MINGRFFPPFYFARGNPIEKKITFIHVDGTFCASNGEVPASAAEAIRRARRNDYQILPL